MPSSNPNVEPVNLTGPPIVNVPWRARVKPLAPSVPKQRRSLRGVQIQSTGLCTPSNLVTNEELASEGFDAEWILQRTGIKARYIAEKDTATSDLAVKAAVDCLRLAKVSPAEVDLIIVATVTPDHSVPSTASIVQGKLGCLCPAFDVNAACSGFVYAMMVASQFLKTGCSRRVLVIGAEKMSIFVDPQDKKTYPLFGDGAGAILMGMNDQYIPCDYMTEELAGPADPSPGILAYRMESLGELGGTLVVPGGGSREPFSQECLDNRRQYLQMDGRPVFKWAVRIIPDIVNELLAMSGLKANQIDLLVTHQANRRIIDAAAENTDIPAERVFVNVDRYGNTSAASIPISLHEAIVQGEISPGSVVMIIGFGGGLTWGGCIIRW